MLIVLLMKRSKITETYKRNPNLISHSLPGRPTPQLRVLETMNQIGTCDKVAYQQYVGGAIARVSCPDDGKWMVELGRVIPSYTLQNELCRRLISKAPYAATYLAPKILLASVMKKKNNKAGYSPQKLYQNVCLRRKVY